MEMLTDAQIEGQLLARHIDGQFLEMLGFMRCNRVDYKNTERFVFELVPDGEQAQDDLYAYFVRWGEGVEWFACSCMIYPGPWLFQKQIEIKTIGDLKKVYEASSGKPFLPMPEHIRQEIDNRWRLRYEESRKKYGL